MKFGKKLQRAMYSTPTEVCLFVDECHLQPGDIQSIQFVPTLGPNGKYVIFYWGYVEVETTPAI